MASQSRLPPWIELNGIHFQLCVQGEDIEVSAEEGKTLLEVAHENDIELEGG